MALILPSWYKGPEYLDVEEIFEDFFKSVLSPNVRVVHWLKPGWYKPDGTGTEPTLRLWRQPGQRDFECNIDSPLLQVAAVTRSHADSWKLQEFVFSMFKALNQGRKIVRSDGSKVQIKDVRFWLGPQIVPEAPIDETFIPVTYQFSVNGLKLQPDYRDHLPA